MAFIGLTSNFISDEVIIKNPIESLKSVLVDIGSRADIKILLFSSSNDDVKRLQAENFDLSMIIRSKSKHKSSDGGKGIPSYSLGDRGRTLFAFDLEINDSSVGFTDLASAEKVIKQSNVNLNKMKKGDHSIDLKTLFRDDPVVLEKIFQYERKIEEANQKIENAVNKIIIDKVDLGKKIDSRVDIMKIIDEGKIKIKTLTDLYPNYRVPHDHDGDGIPDH